MLQENGREGRVEGSIDRLVFPPRGVSPPSQLQAAVGPTNVQKVNL